MKEGYVYMIIDRKYGHEFGLMDLVLCTEKYNPEYGEHDSGWECSDGESQWWLCPEEVIEIGKL
jgi:hypothetical protein